MRRSVLILAALIVVGFLAWEFIPIPTTIWDGGFDLTVAVSSTAGPLRLVSCHAVSNRRDAEDALEQLLPPEVRLWSVVADPFDGRPLTVHVPVSGRDSPLGREISRFQFRDLVVIGELRDGRRVGKLVEIPDGRVSTTVSVSLP